MTYFDEDHEEMKMRRAVERGTRDAQRGSSGTGAASRLIASLITIWLTLTVKATAAVLAWIWNQAMKAREKRTSEPEL